MEYIYLFMVIVMAYMEMFGNCSHSNDNEFMRHSMHMVQAQWQNQHQQSLDSGLSTTQSCSFVHTTSHISSSSSSTASNNGAANNHYTLTTATVGTALTPPLPPSSTLDHRLSPGQLSPARSVSPIINSLPPALPPKRSRASSTKSNSSPPPPRLYAEVTISDETTPQMEMESNHIDNDSDINTYSKHRSNNINNLSPKVNRESGDRTSSPLSTSTPTPTPTPTPTQTQTQTQIPTPINSQKLSPGDVSAKSTGTDTESLLNNDMDLIEQLDIGKYIVLKKADEDGPEIRGGYIDALIVQATNTNIKGSYLFLDLFVTFYDHNICL